MLRCYTELMEDPLRDVVPKFHGHKNHADKGEKFTRVLCDTLEDLFQINPSLADYLELECLLSHFNEPCVMDIKMGTRTYLKNEVLL